jgi:transcriptional regulator with XRE-family HTH domain
MNHGETLRKLRINKGYTQDYVAKKLGINQTSYSKWEHQEYLKEEKLLKVLVILEITMKEVNNFEEEFDPSKPKLGELEVMNNILKIIESQDTILKKMEELENGIKLLKSEKGSRNNIYKPRIARISSNTGANDNVA